MIEFTTIESRKKLSHSKPLDFKWSILQLSILISDFSEKASKTCIDSPLMAKDPKYLKLKSMVEDMNFWKTTFDYYYEERSDLISNQKKIGYKIYQMELQIANLKADKKALERANENLKKNIEL